MAASETPSESRTRESGPRRNALIAITLPSGATVELSFTGNVFSLSVEERALVYGLVDQLNAWQASGVPTPPVGSAKPVPKNGAKPAAAEATE